MTTKRRNISQVTAMNEAKFIANENTTSKNKQTDAELKAKWTDMTQPLPLISVKENHIYYSI